MPSLLKKWKGVHDGVKESTEAYNSICEVASIENQQEWLTIEAEAQERRWEDKTAMDVYDVQADKSNFIIFSEKHYTHQEYRTNCS